MLGLNPEEMAFLKNLEELGKMADSHEGYERFVTAAISLTSKSDDFVNAVISQYHKDGFQNPNLPRLSILIENGTKIAVTQTQDEIKNAVSTLPVKLHRAMSWLLK